MTRYIQNLAIYLLVGIMLLTTSCHKSGGDDPVATPQTLIVYLAGTSLGWAFNYNVKNIEEALKEDIQGDSRVVVVWQNFEKPSEKKGEKPEYEFKSNKSQAIELVYDQKRDTVVRKTIATYDLPQTMDSETLGGIFQDVMQKAPASAYGLIVGAHGWGWVPQDDFSEIVSEAKTRMSQPVSLPRHLLTRFVGDPPPSKGAPTSNGANRFDISTLSNALSSTGKTFEYILFDACFMANVESAYDLRNNAKYIIGSACEIMGEGFPYADAIPYLLKNGGRSYDLQAAVNSFHQYYKEKSQWNERTNSAPKDEWNGKSYAGTISLINCSQLDALALAMKEVNNSLKSEYNREDIQSYEGGDNHLFFDLGDYVDKVCNDESAKSLLNGQLQRTISTKYAVDFFWSTFIHSGYYPITSYSGLNTSAPSVLCRNSYQQTAWYKATH